MSYIQRMTNFKEDKWSKFWESNAEDVLSHVTAMYLDEIEKGNFKTIEEQKMFKKGLYMLPNLYQICFAKVETEKMIQKKKDESKKKKSKLIKRFI